MTGSRLLGLDVARAAAILGMIVVHFSLVAGADQKSPPWMARILACLDGRASAVFMILAGIGVTLMTRSAVASGDPLETARMRRVLAKRGVILLLVGLLNLNVWVGDILRIYGVSLIVASMLLTSSNRRLLAWSAGFVLSFSVLFLLVDFSTNWNWESMQYLHLWTPEGQIRNLFYDGFRSVFPWTGLLLLGMWLGRLDLTDHSTVLRLNLIAAAIAIAAETASKMTLRMVTADGAAGWNEEEARFLFGTESMPALPLFLLAAGGTAVALITLCCLATARWPGPLWYPLVATGQMALTWYLVHIVCGLGGLIAIGRVGTEPLPRAAGLGVAFFLMAVVISTVWKRFARHGPLEFVLRRLAEAGERSSGRADA